MFRRRAAMGIAVCGALFPSVALGQSIRYVDDDASTNGDGLTWDTAYRYLQDAMFEASGGPGITEIHVAGGIYKPDQDEAGQVTPGDRGATFQLLNGLAVTGGYRGCPGGDCTGDPDERDLELYETILSGDLNADDGPDFENYDENSYHVVSASDVGADAVLEGFTITGGNARGDDPEEYGGGMYNYNAHPAVANCTFLGNRASSGGGMCNHRVIGPSRART
jgi:hypothetical protein